MKPRRKKIRNNENKDDKIIEENKPIPSKKDIEIEKYTCKDCESYDVIEGFNLFLIKRSFRRKYSLQKLRSRFTN